MHRDAAIGWGAVGGVVLGLLLILHQTGGGVQVAFGQPSAPYVWGFRWEQAEGTQVDDRPPVSLPSDPRAAWAVDLLGRLGNTAPTPDTVAFVVAWQEGEGTSARFNPLATTQPAPGDACFNYLSGRCGVRDYPDYETGMQATIETLMNGFYPNTLAGLANNAPVVDDGELGTWGTGGANVRALWRK